MKTFADYREVFQRVVKHLKAHSPQSRKMKELLVSLNESISDDLGIIFVDQYRINPECPISNEQVLSDKSEGLMGDIQELL